MYFYTACGLLISSELPLPELLEGDEGSDVVIRFGRVGRGELRARSPGVSYRATPQECCLVYENIVSLLIRGGREIVVEPAAGVHEHEINTFITGPALAVLLQQRGLVVLHASGVEVDGGAVGFLGGKRWGKSTTAAALHARGHKMVTDDVLALDVGTAEHAIALPTFPQFKLWPEAATSLGHDPDDLPRLQPGSEKRARRTDAAFVREPLPLRRLYVISPSADGPPAEGIQPLRPREAFMELTLHSYCAPVYEATDAAADFRRRALLANRVPVFRLHVRRSLSVLPELARSLEEHFARA